VRDDQPRESASRDKNKEDRFGENPVSSCLIETLKA
jgi:hypothetical protein